MSFEDLQTLMDLVEAEPDLYFPELAAEMTTRLGRLVMDKVIRGAFAQLNYQPQE
ncbi:hypothetical protein HDU98_005904, partial [Podochytrium sp. JEL0797]